MKQTLHLAGVGEIPMSVAEASASHLSLTGRQALALLRLLERNRATLEQAAEAERNREIGRGPGAEPLEVPQKLRKGDPRLGRTAIAHQHTYQHPIEGKVTAILRYASNGAEQIEITRKVFALDSDKPGTAVICVHADDVDIL